MTNVIVWLVLALAAGVLGAEAVAWCAPLQRALIRRAAAVLPKEQAERYVEEWYRELEELPDGPLTRLLWVTTLVLRRASLARALGVPRTVVGATGGMKRLLDISITAVGIVVIAPVLLSIAAAIKLQDGGPVFFRQTRVGRNGEMFTMLKFRSMTVDSDARERGLLRLRGEPRVTPLGRILQTFSLDELPNLFNVLGGSMSLVGPRPHPMHVVADMPEGSQRRFLVKPGLTGLWQVSGQIYDTVRGSVRLDLRYVENWSIALDLLILIKTCLAVLQRRDP